MEDFSRDNLTISQTRLVKVGMVKWRIPHVIIGFNFCIEFSIKRFLGFTKVNQDSTLFLGILLPRSDDGHVDKLHRGGQQQRRQTYCDESARVSLILKLTLSEVTAEEDKRTRPSHLLRAAAGNVNMYTIPFF